MKRMLMAATCGLTMILASGASTAQDESQGLSSDYVKVGVLSDMSGVYKALEGPGAVVAAQMAIDDFGGSVLGKPIKLVSSDHQNKPAVASSTARQWIDRENVDMITGLDNSAVGLAVQGLASDKGVITMNTGSGTTELTESQCTEYGIHYVYDTYSLPVGTATAIVKNGGETWFFITADYAFGHSLEDNTSMVVENLGGKVVGGVEAPLGTTDFASYLIQAKASGADVIALANAGSDTVNAIKQANSFGIVEQGQQMAGMLVFLTDVKALGLETAQGLQFTTAFYWDRSDEARKWSQRFFEKHGAMPTMVQAGVYSATLSYLEAVKKAGTDDADAVREVLGDMTINDMFVQGGDILPNGLMTHDMYLVKAKSPEQSEGPWDLLEVVATIPGEKAFIPLSESACQLLDK
ncbi:amino acid/amide ABC transporter substrate-binding protein, HAAT family [Modicisalibacter muralis]|uniref:Amino acid/amide ABC transporter substrate-binding protein, HAAT family n=1 Tax=Modicisalibacter muralis TaxID=119000 RepID=A0A1G9ESF4_9GAMM|nr:ABC transporter substrate-binding protein [Halomonas muralis]SDK79060.1 amino acid/amide ABC transporter substrate-binding protein, HAAT family [Halomonas muralis]